MGIKFTQPVGTLPKGHSERKKIFFAKVKKWLSLFHSCQKCLFFCSGRKKRKWKNDFHFSIFFGFVRNKNMHLIIKWKSESHFFIFRPEQKVHLISDFCQSEKVTFFFWKTWKSLFVFSKKKSDFFAPTFLLRPEQKHGFNYKMKKWKSLFYFDKKNFFRPEST